MCLCVSWGENVIESRRLTHNHDVQFAMHGSRLDNDLEGNKVM